MSFDIDSPCDRVANELRNQSHEVASVRIDGSVQGYVRRSDMDKGNCADYFKDFAKDQVLNGAATFSDVIHVLTRHDYCFVTVLGNVGGVISRDDINKPMMRMWLFGIVTMLEMGLVELIHERFPSGDWIEHLSQGRLHKAHEIQAERQRRNVSCELIDCLQLSDKAQILVDDPVAMERIGMKSKKVAKRTIKDLESLRNHLAHAQDIVQHDWPQIARLSMRLEGTVRQ